MVTTLHVHAISPKQMGSLEDDSTLAAVQFGFSRSSLHHIASLDDSWADPFELFVRCWFDQVFDMPGQITSERTARFREAVSPENYAARKWSENIAHEVPHFRGQYNEYNQALVEKLLDKLQRHNDYYMIYQVE